MPYNTFQHSQECWNVEIKETSFWPYGESEWDTCLPRYALFNKPACTNLLVCSDIVLKLPFSRFAISSKTMPSDSLTKSKISIRL